MSTETTLLFNITLMLVIAGICSILLKKIKLPAIIGYIFAGFLLSPYIFQEVVINQDLVSIFSSIGIVLLMFYIGLELNLGGLKKVASYAATIVIIEMPLMVIIGYTAGVLMGYALGEALFLGVVISCASTAVVLGIMRDNKNIDYRLSRAVTGILVLEDIGFIIILAVASPIMGTTSSGSIFSTLLIIAIFIGITVVIGLTIIPRFLEWVNKHYPGEILFLVGTGFAFGLALISSSLGLSEAIGAFLAGILISQADCCDTMIRKVEPMKEMFMAIFFLSIGMQLDPTLMWSGLGLAILIAVIFVLGKVLSIGIGCMVANFRSRSAFFVATSMVAMGEFSFVVAKQALDANVITNGLYASIVGAAVITMIALPLVSKSSPKLFNWFVKHLPKRAFETLDRMENSRLEVRAKVARSEHAKHMIRRQLLYVIIDVVYVIAVLLGINVLVLLYSTGQVILFIVAVVMVLPALVHMSKRMRVISEIMVSTIPNESGKDRSKRLQAFKFFNNVNSMALFVLMLGIILPLLPKPEGLPISPIGIVLALAIVVWLAWDTINSRYDKVAAILSRSFTDLKEDDDHH
ncbi:MAG: glutathione-regulated potassium-efflux system protein KefC [Methanomassiliicoccales archaeon PtaU1.Bin124]|nr:MAG: glutathione-regulated potassium-efflux system protein KefC [Methanomassiliicoccales archaeon PtaU1.Bin124]